MQNHEVKPISSKSARSPKKNEAHRIAGINPPKTKNFFVEGSETMAAILARTLPPPPKEAISDVLGKKNISVNWLAGDGSDRCYYRIKDEDSGKNFVLMQLSGDDANSLKHNGYEWVNVGRLLHEHGIYAPQTIATLPNFAALIIEDYGDIMMETAVLKYISNQDTDAAVELYNRSFTILAKFLQIDEVGQSHWKDRSFDPQRFDWELHFFRENFLEGVLNWRLDEEEMSAFAADSLRISAFLGEGSKYFVHRDFHSRNVMVKGIDLAVIDFQDARLGPATYDLVSLCFDSYVPLAPQQRLSLIERGLQKLADSRKDLDINLISAEWRPMLLQRQLKALGSFAYLTVKKGRGDYLKYVASALDTLSHETIFDPRWPFLSGKLIESVKKKWAAGVAPK